MGESQTHLGPIRTTCAGTPEALVMGAAALGVRSLDPRRTAARRRSSEGRRDRRCTGFGMDSFEQRHVPRILRASTEGWIEQSWPKSRAPHRVPSARGSATEHGAFRAVTGLRWARPKLLQWFAMPNPRPPLDLLVHDKPFPF